MWIDDSHRRYTPLTPNVRQNTETRSGGDETAGGCLSWPAGEPYCKGTLFGFESSRLSLSLADVRFFWKAAACISRVYPRNACRTCMRLVANAVCGIHRFMYANLAKRFVHRLTYAFWLYGVYV